jgi:hypothetical protein
MTTLHHRRHMRRTLTAVYRAVGGPPESGRDEAGNRYGPTTPGKFTIDRCTQHISRGRYALSKIPWGAPLRDTGRQVFAESGGRWHSVEAVTGMSRLDVIAYYRELYNKSEVPPTWVFNDFGHITCYYFRDDNHNSRRDRGERVSGDMIHTTPENEAERALGKRIRLDYSHGCIHLRPQDIDDMMRRGFLRHGNLVVVHKLGVRPELIPPVATLPPYEVHFWPSVDSALVVGWVPE